MSLKTKLFLLVTAVVIVSFLAVSLIVSNRSLKMAKEDAFSLAEEMAEKCRNEIMAELQGARVTSETLKVVLETLKDYDITDRAMMNDMLQRALRQKEYITAFCVAYEPDSLDGRDADYAGQFPVYDETGRFAPYWNKLGDSISVEPLADIDEQDWYIVPKAVKKEYITEPYPFHVQDQDVMLASFIFPIIHEGEFIGIIASDIVLDKLQEMVSRVDIRGMGEYAEIYSNAGVVVAHPDKSYLGKTITEIVVYDVLTGHPELRDAVIRQMRESGESFPDNIGLDLSSLTPVLAEKILESIPEGREYIQEVLSAIQQGEPYTSYNDAYFSVYMPIRFSEDTRPWSVAVNMPISEVLQVSNEMRNYILIVCAVSVCVLAFVIYLISGSITSPILTLAKAARQLGDGRLNVKVPLIRSSKEIGILSNAFQVMIERIDGLINTLWNNAKELEEKNSHLNNLNEMLTAVNHVAETVMNVEHQQFADVLYSSLLLLGENTGAEGVSIWQNFTYPDGKTYGWRLSAWVKGQSGQPAIEKAVIDLDEFLPGWRQAGKKTKESGGTVLDGRAFFRHHEALLRSGSIFFIPLVLYDSTWGFIAFTHKEELYHLPGDCAEILRSGGMMIASAIIQNQISEDLEEAEEKAATDALTGLTNRNGFLFRASAIYTACKESRLPLTLLFCDLDYFKRINDRYGHPFGDEVLKVFADVIRKEAQPEDVCCRYGGEEFILLLQNCGAAAGQITADRVLETVRNLRFPEYPEFSFTVSIGLISAVPRKQDTLNGYIQKADGALYMAKHNGRNRVVVFSEKE